MRHWGRKWLETRAAARGWLVPCACSVDFDVAGFHGTARATPVHSLILFKRKELNTTDAELRLIAAAAIIGDSNHPVIG